MLLKPPLKESTRCRAGGSLQLKSKRHPAAASCLLAHLSTTLDHGAEWTRRKIIVVGEVWWSERTGVQRAAKTQHCRFAEQPRESVMSLVITATDVRPSFAIPVAIIQDFGVT